MQEAKVDFARRDILAGMDYPNIMSNLFWYMVQRGELGVSNPLDIVYAHLGISGFSSQLQDAAEFGLQVDYTKTPKQVFEPFTDHISSALIGTGLDHLVLSYAESNVDFDQQGYGLASWCPNCECTSCHNISFFESQCYLPYSRLPTHSWIQRGLSPCQPAACPFHR